MNAPSVRAVGWPRLRAVWLAALLLAGSPACAAPPIAVQVPKTALGPAQVAVIVNDADPLSRRIAAYYQARRGIPARNLIHVRFAPGQPEMSPQQFAPLKAAVDANTPPAVQAYVLTWTAPYRVGCMSITTAFAAGYDPGFCASGCKPTRFNRAFDSNSTRPYRDFGLRPTMALAGKSFAQVRALIDRGVAADHTFPKGTAYLVSTSDQARNVRARGYPAAVRALGGELRVRIVRAEFLAHRRDILFYFIGAVTVPDLDTNRFLPGAIADHLTSTGGALTTTTQMSSLRWLQAGATGSYGTVVEPCNFPEKFPDPKIVMRRYLQGETLLDAYWKSVAWPGQGIFIGEPLARPFGGYRVERRGNRTVLQLEALPRGHRYRLLAGHQAAGPYQIALTFTATGAPMVLALPVPLQAFYKVVAESGRAVGPRTGTLGTP